MFSWPGRAYTGQVKGVGAHQGHDEESESLPRMREVDLHPASVLFGGSSKHEPRFQSAGALLLPLTNTDTTAVLL